MPAGRRVPSSLATSSSADSRSAFIVSLRSLSSDRRLAYDASLPQGRHALAMVDTVVVHVPQCHLHSGAEDRVLNRAAGQLVMLAQSAEVDVVGDRRLLRHELRAHTGVVNQDVMNAGVERWRNAPT